MVKALVGAVIWGSIIYAVGIAVKAWLVSFDLRIAWVVVAIAAGSIILSYIIRKFKKLKA